MLCLLFLAFAAYGLSPSDISVIGLLMVVGVDGCSFALGCPVSLVVLNALPPAGAPACCNV